jgi:hypothetical protein
MPRKALIAALLLNSAISATSVPVVAQAFFAAEPPAITGAPFSGVAKTQSVTVFADGNRVVRTNTVRYFRDGQGRTRTERGKGANAVITINDPVSAERYVLRPQNKSAYVYKAVATGTGSLAVASSDDELVPFALLGFRMGIGAQSTTEASSAQTSLGQKTVNGLTASGTRLVRTIPSGVLGNEKPITSTIERWVSTDLGIPVQITQKSSIGGELTLNLEQVMRTEPDATLFSPPSDYTRPDVNSPAPVASGMTAR